MADFLPFVRRWFDETFAEATRAQREGWEAIASGRDTLIVAPTGSGKTLAAFLWALDHLCRLGLDRQLEDRVYVVYVSPLRALINDIEKNLRAPLAGIRAAAAAEGLKLPEIRVAVRTGDTLASQRQAMTRRPPHVLITTPESLFILLTSERFRPALAHTRFLIVDEIHALMGSKRGAHLALSLERLQGVVEARDTASRPQRIGCSATVSPIESARGFLTGATATDAITVDAGFTRDLDLQVIAPVDDFLTAPSDTIWEAALQQIAELVQAHRTTLFFAQSRRAAERLARDLNDRIPDARGAADRRGRRGRVADDRRGVRGLPERGAVSRALARGDRRGHPLARRAAPRRGEARGAANPVGTRERPAAPAPGQPVPRADLRRHRSRQRALRRLRRRDRSEVRHARRGVRDREPARRRVPARLALVEDRQGARRSGPGRGCAGHVPDDPVLEGRASLALVGARAGGRATAPRRGRASRRPGLY